MFRLVPTPHNPAIWDQISSRAFQSRVIWVGTNREEICWLVRRLCVGVAKLLYLLLYGTRYDMLYHLENLLKSMA